MSKCSKLKPPVEVVCDKLIMVLEGIPTKIEYRPIHHPKCTAIKKGTVVLDKHLYSSKKIIAVFCQIACSGINNKKYL